MVLFGISLFYSVKPCGYCLAIVSRSSGRLDLASPCLCLDPAFGDAYPSPLFLLDSASVGRWIEGSLQMTILYLCFNPSSPFVTAPPASHNTTAPYALTDPLPDRGWFNWNGGRLFDPPLVGYQPVRQGPSSASATSAVSKAPGDSPFTERSDADAASAETQRSRALPNGYYDLSWKGLGFVVDLGWRRTEEGMRWEGNVGGWEPRKREMPGAEEVDNTDDRAGGTVADPDASKEEVEIASGSGWRWTRSFVGDL